MLQVEDDEDADGDHHREQPGAEPASLLVPGARIANHQRGSQRQDEEAPEKVKAMRRPKSAKIAASIAAAEDSSRSPSFACLHAPTRLPTSRHTNMPNRMPRVGRSAAVMKAIARWYLTAAPPATPSGCS